MSEPGTVAVLAFDSHVRGGGYQIDLILVAVAAVCLPLILDRDALPVLDVGLSIVLISEAPMRPKVIGNVDLAGDDQNDDEQDHHVERPQNMTFEEPILHLLPLFWGGLGALSSAGALGLRSSVRLSRLRPSRWPYRPYPQDPLPRGQRRPRFLLCHRRTRVEPELPPEQPRPPPRSPPTHS